MLTHHVTLTDLAEGVQALGRTIFRVLFDLVELLRLAPSPARPGDGLSNGAFSCGMLGRHRFVQRPPIGLRVTRSLYQETAGGRPDP